MTLPIRGGLSTLLLVAGCHDVIDLDPLDDRAPIEARVRPAPISGGTLAVVGDSVAVAADPDRDLVHVVDIANHRVLHTIALEDGDEPGRVAIGSGTLAHVVLRGFGGVATIDFGTGSVVERRWLCSEPRGIAFDGANAALFVACADGSFVQLPESGEAVARERFEADLRDVVVVNGETKVSRFRAATIESTDGSGIWAAPASDRFVPHVAWNTRVASNGAIVMIHQLADTEQVPINVGADDLTAEGDLPYGGSGFDPCAPGIAAGGVTVVNGGSVSTFGLPTARLAVDADLSPDGGWLALAVPGAAEGEPTVRVHEGNGQNGCFPAHEIVSDAQITAVAFDPGGRLVMQSREPALILVQDTAVGGDVHTIELEGESRFDTGHEIFHRATESGLSCATCHPEGGDDGHVWFFEGLGVRRTQTLDSGLAESAPFHWDGEMNDLDMIMDEILSHRMGGKRQSPERRASFQRWLFAQERPAMDTGQEDPDLVASGKALFTTFDCGRCHLGPMLGGTHTEEVLGHDLQVPTLRRVAMRAPFMHDGRSATLDDAVRDMIVTTTTAAPRDEDIAALSAYMRTL